MTNDEALNVMEKYHGGNSVRSEDYMQAFDKAIAALYKRTPKKAKGESMRCPVCDTPQDRLINHLGNPDAHEFIYCWNCGQTILVSNNGEVD